MLLLHLVIHEIQVVKSTNYTFGFDCESVYVGTLQFQDFFLKDTIKGWVDNKMRYVMDC
jgi:hypothetical protein